MSLAAGDHVQIIAGPFEGRDGIVTTVTTGDGNPVTAVEVEIEVFERSVQVSVTPADLWPRRP